MFFSTYMVFLREKWPNSNAIYRWMSIPFVMFARSSLDFPHGASTMSTVDGPLPAVAVEPPGICCWSCLRHHAFRGANLAGALRLHSVWARRVADRACQVIARLPQRRDFAQNYVCSGDCVCRAAYTPYCKLVPPTRQRGLDQRDARQELLPVGAAMFNGVN
jgi:hypothetical protein